MFTKPSFRPLVCCRFNANGFRPPKKKRWRCFQVLRCCLFTTLRGWWYDVTLLRVLYGRELWHILVFHILQLFLLLGFTCEMKGNQNLWKQISSRTSDYFKCIKQSDIYTVKVSPVECDLNNTYYLNTLWKLASTQILKFRVSAETASLCAATILFGAGYWNTAQCRSFDI